MRWHEPEYAVPDNLAPVRIACLQGRDTSNKPLEWTGHHQLSTSPPDTLCLPLRGSVRRIGMREQESPADKRGVDGVGRNR